VAVGIARTKTLAKLVSDTAKPFGAVALTDPVAERALLGRTEVTEISGIADRRAARLEPHGIKTCLDLALADRLLVRRLLTRAGEALWYEINGDPTFPLLTERPSHKMLSRGGSLGESTANPDRVFAWLVRNLERLIEELEFHVVRAEALSVYILHKDGTDGFARTRLVSPSDSFEVLLDAAAFCFQRAWRPGKEVTRMHLTASRLKRPGFVQLGLFDTPDQKADAVAKAKREINARLGRFTVRSGATLPLTEVYRDGAQSYDICDVRGKICF
jgi:nucleotidyltransferase/DNA polymerase involved in DNA repair